MLGACLGPGHLRRAFDSGMTVVAGCVRQTTTNMSSRTPVGDPGSQRQMTATRDQP